MVSRPRLSKITTSSSIPTASRSSWSGQIVVGSVTVPVKAYAATVSQSNSALHLVHRTCGQSIAQPRMCPAHGPVNSDDIAKVFRFAPGDDIILSPAELDALKPEDNDPFCIEHLMTASSFDLSLISGRTLFLVPGHAASSPEYSLVCSLLAKHELWAIGRVVLNDRSQLLGLHVIQDILTAFVLHWPQARRGCPAFVRTPSDSQRLRQLAKETIALRKGFNWDDYQDDYDARLNELVRSKIAARTTCLPTEATKSREKSNTNQTSRAA